MPETLAHISGRARKKIDTRAFLVGVPGIPTFAKASAGREPGLHFYMVGVPRIELGLHAPHACGLPLPHTPLY